MSDDWWSTAGGVQSALREEIKRRDARIEDLEAKLAKVVTAYRIEAMRRDDYSHEAFDLHLAQITGETDD